MNYSTYQLEMQLSGYQLLVQRLDAGGPYFNRSWVEFKAGFGSLTGYYWMGNDRLHQLTANGTCSARFDLQAMYSWQWYQILYSYIVVDNETENYRLHISGIDRKIELIALSV